MTGPTDSFDYVIVGAGSAGCVLANRLSEDGETKVCLIEAGGRDSHPFIHVPAAVGAILRNPKVQWGYWTAPQVQLNDRTLPTPRGKVLGGTSAINGMVYFRGQPGDYDEWAAAGATGWSFAEVLPYFLRSENNVDFDGPWHGKTGPMTVSSIRIVNPLNAVYRAAAETVGIPHCEDFNVPHSEGVGLRQGAIRDGRRVTSATAFLKPATGRENLHVMSEALALRVLIEDGRATGVEVRRGGEARRIKASREVILCAGAYGSPALLMLSGVGDPANLKDVGVPVALDRPQVGRDLHDHVAVQIKVRTKDPRPYGVSWRTLHRGAWNVLEYLFARRGPLASHVFESHIVTKSRPEEPRPDLQMPFWTMLPNANLFPIPFGHGYAISVVNNCPESRGSVRLKSRDPLVAPVIDPNLFGQASDMDVIVRGVRIARSILAAEPFKEFEGVELAPGPAVQSDADLRLWLKEVASTTFHPCGSCRMGGDADSVVDPELRVRGIAGLRVADASVFPKITRSNINATVVMIAEKAADMILGKPALAAVDVSTTPVAPAPATPAPSPAARPAPASASPPEPPRAHDAETVAFYDREAVAYAARRGNEKASEYRQAFIDRLGPGAKVLELGTGGGWDAEALIAAGLDVTPTDASTGLAAVAQERLGRPVRIMRADELDETEAYDGVWANACLLHVPVAALSGVLERIWRALKPGGLFFASYKAGDGGDRDSLGRYYNFPSRQDLEQFYAMGGSWSELTIETGTGGGYDGVERTTFNVMAAR
jgi:choline dehydrogenase-like flavoprotein/SAM-dependent methyltransferase